MELKVDRPALAGQDIDPNAFQRVWNRVMPEQTTLPDNAVPAVPTVPPDAQPELPPVPDCPAQELPPVPDCPAQELPPVPDCPAQELPPVPDCPAQELPSVPDCPTQVLPSVPDCPAQVLPSVPDCPAQVLPSVPGCPGCPSRPSVPGCPACPVRPCLGEASKGDVNRLKELMTLAKTGALAGRALARRSNGPTAKAMSVLAQDHRSAFRRLSAAYFLITGKRYTPQCAAPVLPASLPLALRQQFVWEQQWELKNNQAAQDTADPCLRALYQELAQEGAYHAGAIRSILEQMG